MFRRSLTFCAHKNKPLLNVPSAEMFKTAYPSKLPTDRKFWEKLNGGTLSAMSPLLMFSLWHQQTPTVKALMQTGKGELYSQPLMEKLFAESPTPDVRKFYHASRILQKELNKSSTTVRRTGYSMFMSTEGAKPQYQGLPYYVASKKLAKEWWNLSDPQRQYYNRQAVATRTSTN